MRLPVLRTPLATARILPQLSQHRDDAIGFTQFVRSKHDDVVAIGGHLVARHYSGRPATRE